MTLTYSSDISDTVEDRSSGSASTISTSLITWSGDAGRDRIDGLSECRSSRLEVVIGEGLQPSGCQLGHSNRTEVDIVFGIGTQASMEPV